MVSGPKGLAWVKAGHLVTDSAPPVLVPNEGDFKLDSFTVALALSRKVGNKEQKIAIAGDADYASNLRTNSQFLAGNYSSWLTDEAFPIHVFSIPPTDTLLSISLKTAEAQKIVLVWILPAAVLILGTVILLRRKRQ